MAGDTGDAELWGSSATAVVGLLRDGKVSPIELLAVLERRIAAVNGAVNAVVTTCFERARARAGALMAKPVEERGPLCGLPVAIKDSVPVSGVRTTYGSLVYRDWVPDHSDYLVERLEARGALVYCKTNTPEFEAGANTFNEVFGATLNPWDTRLSAGGSSGGAAVALTTGMAWLAQGSDMAGSLRTPASFCGVCGLRPTPGRVANGPGAMPYQNLGVSGPMARNVTDLAFFLDQLSGADRRVPLSLEAPAESFSAALGKIDALRVAFSADLGVSPVDSRVAELCRAAAGRFAEDGAAVEEAAPELPGVQETFHSLRALIYAVTKGDLLPEHRETIKPDVVWNIEKGLALTLEEIAAAERSRAVLAASAGRFFERYDLLLTPTAIVPPFPVEQRFVDRCAGVVFDNYVDWLTIAYVPTILSLPALSLPCGLLDGLPVGLQIVGPPRGEAAVLAAARRLEEILDLDWPLPMDPRSAAVP